MTEQLTEKETNDLFNATSKAIRENDMVKLGELTEAKPATEEETTTPPADPPPPEEKKEEEPGKEETPPADKADDKTEDETSELDKLKEQLERAKKENHDLKSSAGRLPFAQRKINELDKKIAELSKERAAPASHPSTRILPKVEELLKSVKETDPELADAVLKAITEATNGVTEELRANEQDTLKLIRNQEYTQYRDSEVDRLMSMYPNAVEVFQSPFWSDWKKEQSQGVASLADSDNADEVALAFEKYAKDMALKYPTAVTEKDEAGNPPVNGEAAEKAKQIEAERQRKKQTAANVGSPNAAGKVALPDDPNALFEKLSLEIRNKRLGIS